ncbi:MAG: glycosyl hydrolase [Undibacterium sp.]
MSQKNVLTDDQDMNTEKLSVMPLDSITARSAFTSDKLPFAPSRPIPTNQWFSSLFFQKNGQSLYAFPWSLAFTDDGFKAGLPVVAASENIVTGGASSDIVFHGPRPHDGIVVEKWDDLSITTSAAVENQKLFSLLITRGSPFLWLTPKKGELSSFQFAGPLTETSTPGQMSITVGGRYYALYFKPEDFDVISSNTDISLRSKTEKALVTIAILPTVNTIGRFASWADDPISESGVDYSTKSNGAYSTTYTLRTESGKPTVFGLLPHQADRLPAGNHELLGTIETIRGSQQFFSGNEFVLTSPGDMPPDVQLDISSLSGSDREQLRGLVLADAAALQFPEADTYFFGKRLIAAAHLLEVADVLGMQDTTQDIAATLREQFRKWRDGTRDQKGKFFAYDPIVRGVVGYPASFGSELFNDHHFHYGYFITAAAILAKHDPSFVSEYAPFINLLVLDVANTDRKNTDFPYLRNFDVYEGHSWASGQALFADGNNQESTSEAIQAWYGIAEWANVIGAKRLESLAKVLYTEERHAAKTYWLEPSWSNQVLARYHAPIVSLLWGGKAEYGTWFSPATEAKIGIELLPLGPQSSYLAQDPVRLRTILESGSFARGSLFRDAFVMSLALVDRERAKLYLSQIKKEDIDTWNTMSYLTAWVLGSKIEK